MRIPYKTKLLILGSPRSGTYFTTRLLHNLGLDIRHEGTDIHGTVSSLHLLNSSGFSKTIHQIREPLKTISSLHKIDWLSKELWLDQKDDDNFAGHFNTNQGAKLTGEASLIRETSWRYFLEKIKDRNLTRKCMKAYITWNELALEKSEFTFKIEDVMQSKESFDNWLDSIGLIPEDSDYERSKTFTTHVDVSNKDLTRGGEIKQLGGIKSSPDLDWEILESLDSELSQKIKNLTSGFYS
jgi:hypothetical protein|tara:strand:+ start:106 stop:825 length:720 start_codon:yes stop_codon:yes gene_type:complete